MLELDITIEDDIVFPGGELVGEVKSLFGGVHRYALPLVGLHEIVGRVEGYVKLLRVGGEQAGAPTGMWTDQYPNLTKTPS